MTSGYAMTEEATILVVDDTPQNVRKHVSLAELEQLHPWLKGCTGAVCTEDVARAYGARLFNCSRP